MKLQGSCDFAFAFFVLTHKKLCACMVWLKRTFGTQYVTHVRIAFYADKTEFERIGPGIQNNLPIRHDFITSVPGFQRDSLMELDTGL